VGHYLWEGLRRGILLFCPGFGSVRAPISLRFAAPASWFVKAMNVLRKSGGAGPLVRPTSRSYLHSIAGGFEKADQGVGYGCGRPPHRQAMRLS
jgi:hypothetical protein